MLCDVSVWPASHPLEGASSSCAWAPCGFPSAVLVRGMTFVGFGGEGPSGPCGRMAEGPRTGNMMGGASSGGRRCCGMEPAALLGPTSRRMPPVRDWSIAVTAQKLGGAVAGAGKWTTARLAVPFARTTMGFVPRRCASTARNELVLAAESVVSPTAVCRWGSPPLDRAVGRGTAAPAVGCRTVGAARAGDVLLLLRS